MDLSGWIGRPIGVADALGMPWSPGNLFKNTLGSTAARHVSSQEPLSYFGPVAGDLDRMGKLLSRVSAGKFDTQTGYAAWKLAPLQNLVWWRLLHSATDAPVVPEAVAPVKARDLGMAVP